MSLEFRLPGFCASRGRGDKPFPYEAHLKWTHKVSLLLQRNLAVRGFFWEQIETGSRVWLPFGAGVRGAAISQPCCCTCPCSSFTTPGSQGAPGHLTTGAAGNVPMLQASKAMIRMQPCLFGQEGPMGPVRSSSGPGPIWTLPSPLKGMQASSWPHSHQQEFWLLFFTFLSTTCTHISKENSTEQWWHHLPKGYQFLPSSAISSMLMVLLMLGRASYQTKLGLCYCFKAGKVRQVVSAAQIPILGASLNQEDKLARNTTPLLSAVLSNSQGLP